MASQVSTTGCDVLIIGAGLAGKAASLHLAKAGLNVVCIEPAEMTRAAVGESLDWSAPDLLKALGLPMEHLVAWQMATWKRHVTLRLRDGCSVHYVPSSWLGKSPFGVELRTLHVDRVRLDQELSEMVVGAGVTLVRDKVVSIERQGDLVSSVRTASGSMFSARWFLDSSGSGTSFFAREFKLPSIQYGPPKVALWTYFRAPQAIDGTTLYMDPAPSEYLEWVWEIPVNPDMVSVGYITTGSAMKEKRDRGLSNHDIFQQQLAKFSRFDAMRQAGALESLNVTSFRCRAYVGVAGPNWLIAGEAASMVDPITANGVTAALRHAAEAASLILKYRRQGRLPLHARALYSSRIVQLAKFFNSGIEKIVYEPTVRNRIGVQQAGTVYTSPAWTMNLIYARLRPKGLISTAILNSLLGILRFMGWSYAWFCREFQQT